MERGSGDLHAACKERIAALEGQVRELQERLGKAEGRAQEVEARLNQNSQNSSKPPSSPRSAHLDFDIFEYRRRSELRKPVDVRAQAQEA